MIYDYEHPDGRVESRNVNPNEKDNQVDDGGHPLRRLSHFRSLQFRVPASFAVSVSDIYGPPGSATREQHEADLKSGAVVPVTRWV